MGYKPVRGVYAVDQRGRITLPDPLCAEVAWLGLPKQGAPPLDVILTRIAGVALAVLPADAPRDPYNLSAQWSREGRELRLTDRWSAQAALARYHADVWSATLNPGKKQPRWRLQIPEDLVRIGLAPGPATQVVLLAHSGWLEIWREEVWLSHMVDLDVRGISLEAQRELPSAAEDPD